MNASSSKPAASTKPAGDFLSAAKTALENGAEPSLVATYLGHAAESPTANTLRLLASLLTESVRRSRDGGGR